MIKTTAAIILGASVIGTGAQGFTPKSMQIAAGGLAIEVGRSGFDLTAQAQPEFSLSLISEQGRRLTLNL